MLVAAERAGAVRRCVSYEAFDDAGEQLIVGTWSYVTIAGPTADGEFTATKMR